MREPTDEEKDELDRDPEWRFVAERWDGLPWWMKKKIVITVFFATWQSSLASWWLELACVKSHTGIK